MAYGAIGPLLTSGFQPGAQAPVGTMPSCVTQAEHDAAVRACQEQAIKGLGAPLIAMTTMMPAMQVSDVHPCTVAKLPICPKRLQAVGPTAPAPTPVPYAEPVRRRSSVAAGVLAVVAVVAVGGGIVYYVRRKRRG